MRSALVTLQVVVLGCGRVAGEPSGEAVPGATSGEATLASAQREAPSARSPRDRQALADSAAAFRRDREAYRARLQSGIEAIEGRLSARAEGARGGRLRAARESLERDLAALDRTTAADWATLRARIDRDLHRTSEGR